MLDCANGFKAKLMDNSVDGEVRVDCKAELDPLERNFTGSMKIKMTAKKGKIQLAAASWQSENSASASSVSVESGELCNAPYCITYKKPSAFNWAVRFVCRVDYNGVVRDAHIWVKAEGKYGIRLWSSQLMRPSNCYLHSFVKTKHK